MSDRDRRPCNYIVIYACYGVERFSRVRLSRTLSRASSPSPPHPRGPHVDVDFIRIARAARGRHRRRSFARLILSGERRRAFSRALLRSTRAAAFFPPFALGAGEKRRQWPLSDSARGGSRQPGPTDKPKPKRARASLGYKLYGCS
jgi:hypothetical protein